MLTVALLNLKPGTGKTTSAVWLAHAFMERGRSVVLVDADPAASALAWADMAGGFPFPILALPVRDLHTRISGYAKPGDVVVIDAPQLEDHPEIARSVIRASDEILVPMAPSVIEINRTGPIRGVITKTADGTRMPRVAILLNRTVANANSTSEARDALGQLGYDVLSLTVPRLELFAQSFGSPVYTTGTVWPGIAKLLDQEDS
jgi:chromosome partitioning protein